MSIEISEHARLQMVERGVSENEVAITIEQGESEAARGGRMMYRKNFRFDREWRGRNYRIKQVAPVVVQESDNVVVITVYAFYF